MSSSRREKATRYELRLRIITNGVCELGRELDMEAKVAAGTVVFHHWDPVRGLVEQETLFDSIDELFGRCLEIRIQLQGFFTVLDRQLLVTLFLIRGS